MNQNKDQISSKMYDQFLNYLILLIDRINQQDLFSNTIIYSDTEQLLLKKIMASTSQDQPLMALINQALEHMHRELSQNQSFSGWSLFSRCLNMKNQLKETVERLVIIDSV